MHLKNDENTQVLKEIQANYVCNERKKNRWSPSALNFPNPNNFQKIIGMHLQKALFFLYIKELLPQLLYLWNYNSPSNKKMIYLIFTQAHR